MSSDEKGCPHQIMNEYETDMDGNTIWQCDNTDCLRLLVVVYITDPGSPNSVIRRGELFELAYRAKGGIR